MGRRRSEKTGGRGSSHSGGGGSPVYRSSCVPIHSVVGSELRFFELLAA